MLCPFRLKNIDATYLRIMNKVLRNQVGKMIEVYIDDMILMFE